LNFFLYCTMFFFIRRVDNLRPLVRGKRTLALDLLAEPLLLRGEDKSLFLLDRLKGRLGSWPEALEDRAGLQSFLIKVRCARLGGQHSWLFLL